MPAARRLAQRGVTVLVHGRVKKRVEATLRSLCPGRHEGFVAELSSPAEVRRLAAEVAGRHAALDAVLNSAGVFADGSSGRHGRRA